MKKIMLLVLFVALAGWGITRMVSGRKAAPAVDDAALSASENETPEKDVAEEKAPAPTTEVTPPGPRAPAQTYTPPPTNGQGYAGNGNPGYQPPDSGFDNIPPPPPPQYPDQAFGQNYDDQPPPPPYDPINPDEDDLGGMPPPPPPPMGDEDMNPGDF